MLLKRIHWCSHFEEQFTMCSKVEKKHMLQSHYSISRSSLKNVPMYAGDIKDTNFTVALCVTRRKRETACLSKIQALAIFKTVKMYIF